MVNRFWSDPFEDSRQMNMQQLPTQVNPTVFENPRVSPTNQYMQRNQFNTVVPHVHPSHLMTVNEHMTHHQHFFPHTTSMMNRCYETNTMCGTPFRPWNCR